MRSRYSALIVVGGVEARSSIENLLRGADFEVYATSEGCEALRLLDCQRFDVAVIDLMMPRLDGIGLLRALIARPEDRRPRAIVLISQQPELRRRLRALRVCRVVPSPCDPLSLFDELQHALREADPARAG